MASRYSESDSGDRLRSRVECIWTAESTDGEDSRVYPDGCIDILYRRQGGRSVLELVGAMTAYEDVSVSPGTTILGVRFRPGGVHGFARQSSHEWTGQTIDLTAITPREARWIKQQLDDDPTPARIASILESALVNGADDAAQRAIACIERQRGLIDLGWVAEQANLSERQFRRVCLARTGLSPKQLCRALRFRYSLSRLRRAARGELTAIALDCGYYDQAHFVHEFREWSGRAPSEFMQR